MANLITFGRMALIIPFIAVFLADAPWNMTAAFVVFVVAALSDLVDGRIARARGEVTAIGATLDPIADKLLITTALILLLRNGIIHGAGVIAVIIIILREILISGLREAVAAKGEALPVTSLAKWKTAAQLISAGLLLAAAPSGAVGEVLRAPGSVMLWFAAILTFWTGADYAVRASRLLAQSDRDGKGAC